MKHLIPFTYFLLSSLYGWNQLLTTNFPAAEAQANGYNGNGCSFVDFNLDGWDDATFSTLYGVLFYENNHQGGFNEVDLGIDILGESKHPTWVDIDNDGDLDFFSTNYNTPCNLWVNDGNGNFSDISASSGILQTYLWESNGASWGDYNNDGFLDVYITNYNVDGGVTNYLYQNNGDQTFTDVTPYCNCSNGVSNSFQSLWFDINDDGLLDLAVINDRLMYPNSIYQNLGNGLFVDIGPNVNFNQSIYAMSLSLSDFDNDDDGDFYITNGYPGNLFLRYQNNQYMNIAGSQNMEVYEVCWGAQWIDYDNDADEDLYVGTFTGFASVSDAFFVNNESNFIENNDVIYSANLSSYASCTGDYNNDGFSDILVHTHGANFKILTNEPNVHNWIKVSLTGTASNTFGVGATIRLYGENQFQRRDVHAGEDYMAQDSYTEQFGLGELTQLDSLVVTWPSGWEDTVIEPQIKSLVAVVEGSSFNPEITLNGSSCSNETNFLTVTGEAVLLYEWDNGTVFDSRPISESGSYSVTVTNEFGISKTIYADIELNEAPNVQANISNVTCADGNDGIIELLNVSETNIELVEWNSGLYAGELLTGLPAGEFVYVLTDVNGCSAQDTVFLSQPAPISANLEVELPLCSDEFGMAEVNPSGGTGNFEVNWSADDASALPEGDFEVEVIDESGCSILIPFSITIPSEISAELTVEDANDGDNGSASISVEGGTPPYTVQWSNSDIGEQTDQLGQGAYVVIVTDNNGCTWSESFSIIDLGISENSEQASVLKLAEGIFQIESVIPVKDSMVLDATGRVISTHSQTTSPLLFDLTSQSIGLYFILIRLGDGTQLRFEVVNP